jgi:F0F1-type ATP synthase epsilon subunit
MSELDEKQLAQLQGADYKQQNYTAYLGSVSISEKKFLIICDRAIQACTIDDCQVYTVASVLIIPFEYELEQALSNSKSEAHRNLQIQIDQLKKVRQDFTQCYCSS